MMRLLIATTSKATIIFPLVVRKPVNALSLCFRFTGFDVVMNQIAELIRFD